jgi:hypothetical protein
MFDNPYTYLTQVATYQKPSQNKLKTAYLSAKQRFFCIKIQHFLF